MAGTGISAADIEAHLLKVERVKVIIEKGLHRIQPVSLIHVLGSNRNAKPGGMGEIEVAKTQMADQHTILVPNGVGPAMAKPVSKPATPFADSFVGEIVIAQ
jgi:hypothetical protein